MGRNRRASRQRGPFRGRRRREPRRRGYHDAVLADARGRPLVYADVLSVIPSHPGGSVGLAGAAFAPGVLEQMSHGLPTVRIHSHSRLRLVLHGFRVSFHAGEQPHPEGGWHVQAVIGTYQALENP